MPPPPNAPDGSNTAEWSAFALEYLAGQLRDAAPKRLGPPAFFPRNPLESEGPCLVFSFIADRAGQGGEMHYVVVGQTEPNYYPAYGLDADEAFALHIGTRFMLVLQIAQVPLDLKPQVSSPKPQVAAPSGPAPVLKSQISDLRSQIPNLADYDAAKDARAILDRVAPDAKLEDVAIAAAFDVDTHLHAVLSARVNNQPTFILAAESPPGFSRRTDLPPQVVYRLHLGMALLAEPDPDDPKSR